MVLVYHWYGNESFTKRNAEHERLKGTFDAGSVSSHDPTRQPYFRLQKAQGKGSIVQ